MRLGMVLVVRPYDRINIYIYSDKHTSSLEEIKISPPNLFEGGSLHSPITSIHIKSHGLPIHFHHFKLQIIISELIRV